MKIFMILHKDPKLNNSTGMKARHRNLKFWPVVLNHDYNQKKKFKISNLRVQKMRL
jgi:hypothetical protein